MITLSSVGKSLENREIPLLTVAAPGDVAVDERPAILFTGAHHAREAITPQMTMYALLRLIHSALHGDHSTAKLLRLQTLYIIPVVNIDGWYDI